MILTAMILSFIGFFSDW